MVKQLRNMAFGVAPHTTFDCRHAVMTRPSGWTAEEQQHCKPLTSRATIATDSFAPVLYTVPRHRKRVPVILDNGNPSLRRAFAQGVPIPARAKAASGSDGQLTIWQPAKDTMWEFWRAQKKANGWHAGYGGRIRHVSRSPGHYRDIVDRAATGGRSSHVRYLEQHSWGAASSSIPNLPGLMTVDQLRSGAIRHALDFGTWANAPGRWVYPAQRTDGRCRGPGAELCSQIPQGARFRLPAGYPVNRLKNPIVRMIARAVKHYGMVLNNTTGAGMTFYAEGWRQHGWQDPYTGPKGLFTHDPNPSLNFPTQFLRRFPWGRLQMLKHGRACTVRATACPRH